MRERHQCNIPWAILLDPTSACNLHCTGCWAAEYGYKQNLSFEDIDSIVTQGKELGTHIYIYTGGEPLVRKHDLIRICEKHPDCVFLCFTNSTLIDEAFCRRYDSREVSLSPPSAPRAMSTQPTPVAAKVPTQRSTHAMKLLRERDLPFGISTCWTSANADTVATEENMDWMIGEGALFCWYFHFMPVGRNATPELMPTPEQREHMYHFIREMREKKPLFTLDFQNDGEFVGGCIAGGRRYLHINAAGDVEPCVFIHYSNANIRNCTLLEALQSPIFMAYHDGQPFNDNHAAALPDAGEPADRVEEMVESSGARGTDLVETESAHDLAEKCRPAALGMGARGRAPVDERRRQARTLPSTPVLRHGRNRQGEVCAARPHHARGLRSGPPRGRDGTGAGAGR